MLDGLWVKVKAEMKDGSRIVDHADCGMSFLKYRFKKNGSVEQSTNPLFNQDKQNYNLSNNVLTIGTVKYDVLKLSGDTLKIAEITPNTDDSKIKAFYFVKTQSVATPVKRFYNDAIKDSVYDANNFLFPEFDAHIDELMKLIPGPYQKSVLQVRFIVNKEGKIKDLTILKQDSTNEDFTRSVVDGFKSSNSFWLAARIGNRPVNTSVDLILTFTSVPVVGKRTMNPGTMNAASVQCPFLLPVAFGKPISGKEMQLDDSYFNMAAAEVEKQNYAKAIEYLTQCVRVNDIDLDAYYLRALCNLKLGNKDKACSDWTILSRLGQVPATKNLANYCKN
ncbi:MAG TPA: tetratricopeptide repeat protein [Mucilaginibacter sp.]|nr:tetratricopeptide repeat protein [Mucilaginibacter sp.]